MRNRLILVLVGVFATLALIGAACSPADEPEASDTTTSASETTSETATTAPDTTSTTSEAAYSSDVSVSGVPLDPDAVFGGTLVRAYYQEGPTYNSWGEKSNLWSELGQPMTNNLIRTRSWGDFVDFENAAYLEFHPSLAASWEQAPDGLSWTFKLQDGAVFSTGEPFTCEDAKWSLDTVRTAEGITRSVLQTQFIAVTSITCADPTTLIVNLSQPKGAMLELLASPHIVMLSKGHYFPDNMEEIDTKPSVGTGPYLLTKTILAETYELERNPNYWDQPFPYLDGIKLQYLAKTAIPTAMRAGRVQWGELSSVFGGGAHDTLTLECRTCVIWPKGFGIGISPSLMVNHLQAPWNTPEIKDAISLAFDRQKLADLQGKSVPFAGPFFPGSFWQFPADRLIEIPGYDFGNPEANKARARELLQSAGYAPGELVIPLDIGVYNFSDAPVIIEDLEAVGFTVESQQFEVGRTYEKLGAGDFEVMLAGFAGGGVDPDFMLYEFHYTGSDRNYGRWTNMEYDRLVDEQSVTVDPDARRAMVWDAAEIALREHAMMYGGTGLKGAIHDSSVLGWMPHIGFATHIRFDHAYLGS
jgi:peptide/nickel transport system substrate-binding protein